METAAKNQPLMAKTKPTDIPVEFDLNNPPKVPYDYQEFPKLVYRAVKPGEQATQARRIVNNKQEEADALKLGFSTKVLPGHEDPGAVMTKAPDSADASASAEAKS